MTSPAVLEIHIAAKGTPAVVTCRTCVVAGGEMFLRTRRSDLPFLRQASDVVMALGTVQTLARAVLRVTETNMIRDGVSRRARVSFLRVTNSA